ncbi:MAG: hypothetical protein K2L67_00790 [Clostridia bacterium]|nr:hypothetical protein [Clostridia bacterium]
MARKNESAGQMKRLQRRLIPLNIIVSVLAVVAAVTLFFSPLLEIKLGNITGNPEVVKFVDDKISEALDNGAGEVGGQTGDLLADVDMPKIIVPVVESVFTQVNGNVAISTYGLLGFATSENPGGAVADLLLSEKDGLLTQLTESLVKAVMDLPQNKQVQDAIEEVILVSMSTQVKASVPDEYKSFVEPEALAQTLKSMDGAKNEEEVLDIIDGYLAEVEAKNPEGGVMDPVKKQEIKDMMSKVYQDTVEHAKDENGDDAFSVEAMVCVAASGVLNSEEFDEVRNEDGSVDLMALIDKMMGGMGGGSEGEGGENGGNGGGNPEDGGASASVLKNAVAFDGEVEGGAAVEVKIYTTYEDLFGKAVKLDENEVRTQVKKLVDEYVGVYIKEAVMAINEMNGQFPVFWAAFGAFAFFACVWAIMFLFAFLRLFAKNKRFTMWYVKLFGAIPVILFWLVPVVAGWAIPAYFPALLGEFAWALPVLLGAIGTMTWVSGICYVVLWALSIVWAFPVKHKIRKLIKQRRG